MLAISSPPLFSDHFCWLLEDPISHHFINTAAETSDNSAAALHSSSSSSSSQTKHCDSNKFDQINNGEHVHQPDQMVKKLNHNASERDRRKKINSLYSSLRSLLTASDHKKKLSIPSTISRVLKYIPELQNEVERLIEKKEELTARTISNKENSADFNKQKRRGNESSSLVISASEIGDKEVVIHISTLKINKRSFAEAVSELEDEGLFLLNSSCIETFEDRVFHTLHFQVEGTMVVELDMLRDKLSSCFEKEDKIFISEHPRF
ncbi:PREDICTED: transcription factor ORG2-like isoform X2 [Nicotiana attenuata]|nr:PREDICTED: transcription factor ORG2-like isoform X2 [Nicotiana attenuata]